MNRYRCTAMLLLAALLLVAPLATSAADQPQVFDPAVTIIEPESAQEFFPGVVKLDDGRIAVLKDTLEESGGFLDVYNETDLAVPFFAYNMANNPVGLVTGDFDNDGKPDLGVLTSSPIAGLYMFWGEEGGDFLQTSSYPDSDSTSITTFTENGKDYIVVASAENITIYGWEPNHLVNQRIISSKQPGITISGDIDGDGDFDLLAAQHGNNFIGTQIYWNINGTFVNGPFVPGINGTAPVALGIAPHSIFLGFNRLGLVEYYRYEQGGITLKSTEVVTNVVGQITSNVICDKTVVVLRRDLADLTRFFINEEDELVDRVDEAIQPEYYNAGTTGELFPEEGYLLAGHQGLQFLAANDNCTPPPPPTTPPPTPTTPPPPTPRSSISVSINGPDQVRALEPVEWVLRVENDGETVIPSTIITNVAPIETGGSVNIWNVSNLGIGAVWTTTVVDRLQILSNPVITDSLIVSSDQTTTTQITWASILDPTGLGLFATLDVPQQAAIGNLPASIVYEVRPDPDSSYNPLLPIIEELHLPACFRYESKHTFVLTGWSKIEAMNLDTTTCSPGRQLLNLDVSQQGTQIAGNQIDVWLLMRTFFPIIIR